MPSFNSIVRAFASLRHDLAKSYAQVQKCHRTKGASENAVYSPAEDIPNSSIMKDVNGGVSSENPKAQPAKKGATAA
nr:hypothetical protein [Tanacetum cinerariifolium]